MNDENEASGDGTSERTSLREVEPGTTVGFVDPGVKDALDRAVEKVATGEVGGIGIVLLSKDGTVGWHTSGNRVFTLLGALAHMQYRLSVGIEKQDSQE